MAKTAKKQWGEKAVLILALVSIIALFFFFLREILIPFLNMEIHHDLDGARVLLREKGILGFFAVTLVEASTGVPPSAAVNQPRNS